jgi:hypothetical protein
LHVVQELRVLLVELGLNGDTRSNGETLEQALHSGHDDDEVVS